MKVYKRCLYIIFVIFMTLFIDERIGAQNLVMQNPPSIFPDRIMMSVTDDLESSRAISWRTQFNDTISIGEIAIADADSKLESMATRVYGSFSPWEEGSQIAMGHKVLFENLIPGRKYVYRVGNGKYWSEWIQFNTSPPNNNEFSFLYFGDIQNNVKSYGARVIRQAYSHFPNSQFMIFAGDLISESTESYWNEFFYTGGWIYSMIPSMPTPGNHEYDTEDGRRISFSKQWNQIYSLPRNGPQKEFFNRFYYVDYSDVRFISIDSPAVEPDTENSEKLLKWLEDILSNNPSQWTIVFSHFPVYSCSLGRNNKQYKNKIKPILEKYAVDLVLQGHDHTYCRGRNLKEVSDECLNPPMYVVSIAGPKMYALDANFWADRVGARTQLYQNITIKDKKLNYKSFMVNGDLYDEFTILKVENKPNKIIESKMISIIEERGKMPNGYHTKYSDTELESYRERFKNNFDK